MEEIKKNYKEKEFDLKWDYENEIKHLEKENNRLNKIIDKFPYLLLRKHYKKFFLSK